MTGRLSWLPLLRKFQGSIQQETERKKERKKEPGCQFNRIRKKWMVIKVPIWAPRLNLSRKCHSKKMGDDLRAYLGSLLVDKINPIELAPWWQFNRFKKVGQLFGCLLGRIFGCPMALKRYLWYID